MTATSRGLALALGLAGAPLLAQQPPDSTRTDSATVLAPVRVRALRAITSGERAPWAVTVRERDAAERARAGLALDEALRGVPGIQVDNRHNWALGERISVRGFGARAQFGVRGVKVIVNGVPATLPDGQTTLNHVDVSSVRRAEVLRGAASSLYGNAAGGVILLETAPPPLVPFEIRGEALAGAHGLRRASVGAGGTSGGTGWLLQASGLDSRGYRAHASADSRWLLARAVHDGGLWGATIAVSAVDYDARNPGSLSDSLLRVDRRQAFRGNVVQKTGEAGEQLQVGGTLRRSTRFAELELAPYVVTREIDNPIPGRVIDLARRGGGMRALARATENPDARTWWAAGAEADVQRDERRNFLNAEGDRGALVLDQRERVKVAAAFAQLGFAPASRLRLDGGVRWDRATFSADDRLVTATDPDDSGERTMSAVSPSVGATFRAGERVHLYANLATSFETPTTTELANRPTGAGGFNPDLEPQRAVSLEVGAKGAGSRLRWEAALYHARVRDGLVPFEVEGTPGRQYFRNAGRATHRGAEAGARWLIARWLRAEASYAWTDARFDEYRVGTLDHAGNRVPGIAPHRGDVALTWGGATGPFAAVEVRAASRMTVDDANAFRSPGYAVLDLRTGLASLRTRAGEATLFGGVSNVLGTRYNASVVVNAFGRRYFEPAPERALFAGASVGWGR